MTRYEELLSLYLDDDPTATELQELANLLKADSNLAENFQQELLIWETWSQEHAPERASDAFIAGLHTRLRAEQDAPSFERSMTKKLNARKNPFMFQPILAIAAILVLLLSIGYFFNPADLNTGLISSAEAGPVRIHGECVCLRCTLQKAERCGKAIRYIEEDGSEHLIRLMQDPELKKYNKCFCNGPTRVLIEGEIVVKKDERLLRATTLNIENNEVL